MEIVASSPKTSRSFWAYVLTDAYSNMYRAECVDLTDDGFILEVEEDAYEDGIVPDRHIDSRYLEEMGLEIHLLLKPPYGKQ